MEKAETDERGGVKFCDQCKFPMIIVGNNEGYSRLNCGKQIGLDTQQTIGLPMLIPQRGKGLLRIVSR